MNRARNTKLILWLMTGFAAAVAFNRFIFGLGATANTPLWAEVFISLGIISAAALVFLFAIEHFHVWDITQKEPESLPHTPPSFDYASRTWLGTPEVSGITKFSLVFILSFAFGMFLMPGEHLHNNGMPNIKASRASGYDTLYLNLNGDGKFVKFPHQEHINLIKMFDPSEINSNVFHNDSTVSNDSCFMCHHLKLPGEKLSACSECHSSMYQQVDFFNHSWHQTSLTTNLKCNDCHKTGMNRNAQSAKSCTACHQTYKFASNKNTFNKDFYILSYTDALHRLCEYCHTIE